MVSLIPPICFITVSAEIIVNLIKSYEATFGDCAKRRMSISSSAATMRVLSVMRHWITKHNQVSGYQLSV